MKVTTLIDLNECNVQVDNTLLALVSGRLAEVHTTVASSTRGTATAVSTADVEELGSRWSELKEVVAAVRHDMRGQQNQIDVWQSSEVNLATTELRAIVHETTDLCQAMKSMQSWMPDVESLGTQRNTSRTTSTRTASRKSFREFRVEG